MRDFNNIVLSLKKTQTGQRRTNNLWPFLYLISSRIVDTRRFRVLFSGTVYNGDNGGFEAGPGLDGRW